MRHATIPVTDSIQELATFWDNHDITDYENDLNAVDEKVFERKSVVKIRLAMKEADLLSRMASMHGIPCDELVKNWVVEKLHPA